MHVKYIKIKKFNDYPSGLTSQQEYGYKLMVAGEIPLIGKA
jgi:hypothetical protein